MKKTIFSIVTLMLLISNLYSFEEGDSVRDTGYSGGWAWNGVIDKIYSNGKLKISLTSVTCNGFFCTQINAGECSGNKVLTQNSSGETIVVPKSCVFKN